MGRYWIVTLTLVALQFGGCSTNPTTLDKDSWVLGTAKRKFVTEREQLARGYESHGSYQLALQEWQVISAVIPAASEPRTEIDRLEKRIGAAVKKHRREAKFATARSDYRRAQLHLLKILALQPDDSEAIRKLKKLELRRAYAGLAQTPKVSAKATQTYAMPTARHEGEKDGIKTLALTGQVKKTPLVDSGNGKGKGNLQLALQHISNHEYEAALERFILARQLKEAPEPILDKHISEMRSMLAEQHYDDGVSAFRAARYDQAVSEFKKALEYDSEHQKARLYLGSASELQMRMER